MRRLTTWAPATAAASMLTATALTAVPAASARPASGSPLEHAVTRTMAGHTVSSHKLLSQLKTHAEHQRGYERSKFHTWASVGGGCDVRDHVLAVEATVRPHVASGCKLEDGEWTSPYDGKTTSNPSTFDIDHLVPLAEAWQSGGWRWASKTRNAYANDIGYAADLIAVSAHANRSKGESEPQNYLPPRKSFDCTYLADWVAVKYRWHLSVNAAERAFVKRRLTKCGWPKVDRPLRPAIHHRTIAHHTSQPVKHRPKHRCTTTSSGSCIRGGQFCRQADYGHSGWDANGRRWVCKGSRSHPHWKRP